jgi:hypothetical protein
MQLNYLLDAGAFKVNADGTFAVDPKKVKAGAKALTTEIMTIQATGDYARAKKLLELAIIRPPTQKILDSLKDVPVDIAPKFVTADQLIAENP